MEADVLNALESQSAYFNGGHDRDNKIILFVPVQYDLDELIKNHLKITLNYLLTILR